MNLPSGKDFRPSWPLTSGHIQTMLSSSGVRRMLLPKAAREVLEGAETVVVNRAFAQGKLPKKKMTRRTAARCWCACWMAPAGKRFRMRR